MSQFFRYPPISVTATNPSVGLNGVTAPNNSTEVGGIGPDGNLHGISTDNLGNQNVNVISSVLPTGAATAANQTNGQQKSQLVSSDGSTVATVTGANALKVDGSAVTQPISAAALPLPAGASTSALQSAGNTSLTSIDTKTPALGQALAAASVPVVLTAAQISTLTPLSSVTVTQATGTNLHTVVDSSALPTGAATSGLQSTGNTSLSSIDTKTPALVSGRVPVDGSSVTQPISAASLPLPTGAATETTLAALNTKTPALGQATMAASTPVAIASDQAALSTSMPDMYVAGAAAQTVIGNNVLLASAGTAAIDVAGYRSASVQIVSTGTAGTFIFEGSNDNVNFQTIPVYNQLVTNGTVIIAAITATASQLIYTFPTPMRYVRVRIATTITGGSIQAFTRWTQAAWTPATFQVANSTAASLATTVTGTITAVTAITNALPAGTNVIGFTKQGGKTIVAPVRNDYTTTNVTTGAYVQLVASMPSACTEIEIFDSSGQTLQIGVGAAGSEVTQCYIFPGGNGRIPLAIAASARVAVKAVSATANAGELDINFYN